MVWLIGIRSVHRLFQLQLSDLSEDVNIPLFGLELVKGLVCGKTA